MENTYDYILVGSGIAGSIVAHTLVTQGADVLLLDVGHEDKTYKDLIPDENFLNIRQEETEQYQYFLGKEFEGIPWGDARVGAQLTPPRQHITRQVEELLLTKSSTFKPMESLAYGGLGCGWGLGCNVYSDQELEKIGLEPSEMAQAYQHVCNLIGVSSKQDEVRRFTLGKVVTEHQAPLIDVNSQRLLDKYQKKKEKFLTKGFHLGQPAVAVITKDQEERKALAYHNMDFYTDQRRSAFRPWVLVDRLKEYPNFHYQNNAFVTSFEEQSDSVQVNYIDSQTFEKKTVSGNKLILATGAIGTARLVLRSLGNASQQLPILCNPYVYFACLQPTLLGKSIPPTNITSLGQLALFYDNKAEDVITSGIYSYSSLLLFKLMKEAPLNFKDSRILFQYLYAAFSIAGVHYADYPTDDKFLKLETNPQSITKDHLSISYHLNDEEKTRIKKGNKRIGGFLKSLGCIPLKKMQMPAGSSIHYAGTLPFSDTNQVFTLQKNGRLNGAERVLVADSSGFKFLPSQGLSFTIMANAYLVAQNALKS